MLHHPKPSLSTSHKPSCSPLHKSTYKPLHPSAPTSPPVSAVDPLRTSPAKRFRIISKEEYRRISIKKGKIDPTERGVMTASRTFSKKEQKYLLSILRTSYLDDLYYEIKTFSRLSGFKPWAHPHRFGPAVLVTFLLPRTVSRDSRVINVQEHFRKWDHGQIYREKLKRLVYDLFGEENIIGFRLCPHRSPRNDRHAHMLLSLLRFPEHLRAWARAFKHRSKKVQRRWFPLFFCGPHLDPNSIEKRLTGPYRKMLSGILGAPVNDQGNKLVHVTVAQDDGLATMELNRTGTRYLDRSWKHFDRCTIQGYYLKDHGREVLLYDQDAKRSYRVGRSEFIEKWLVGPTKRWFRRCSYGFVASQSVFAGVMDFAADMPHPTNPDEPYFSMQPAEMARWAEAEQMRFSGNVTVPHDGPVPEELKPMRTKRPSRKPFPQERLLEIVKQCRWIKLKFHVPPGRLTSWDALAKWHSLAGNVNRSLRSVLCKYDDYLSLIVMPQRCPQDGLDDIGLAVYLFPCVFSKTTKGLELVEGWLGLQMEERIKYLAAFMDHPPLVITGKQLKRIETAWRRQLKLGECDALPKLVRRCTDYVSPDTCYQRCLRYLDDRLTKDLSGVQLGRNDDGTIKVSVLDRSIIASCYLSKIGSELEKMISPKPPKSFGCFASQDKKYSRIVRLMIDHRLDPDCLRKDHEADLLCLCDAVGLDRDTYRPRDIIDMLGNWASQHREGSRPPKRKMVKA